MSDAASRSLLSLWGIKDTPPPEVCLDPDAPTLLDERRVQIPAQNALAGPDSAAGLDVPVPQQAGKPVDRAKSALQWNSIFAKPKKSASQEPQAGVQQPGEQGVRASGLVQPILNEPAASAEESSPAEPVETLGKHLHRPLNLRKPFEPSFLQVLKVPSARLAEIEQRTRVSGIEDKGTDTGPCNEGGVETKVRTAGDTERNRNSAERATLVHVLRAPPDKLRAIKPRVHSFFAKRSTSSASNASKPVRKIASLRPIVLKHPQWNIVHVRPNIVYEPRYAKTLPRRTVPKRRLVTADNDEWTLFASGRSRLHDRRGPMPHLPRRVLHSSEQVRALAALSQSKSNGDFLNELIVRSGEPKPFDRGELEGSMWSEKYAPQSVDQHLISVEAQKVASWAAAQMQKRQKQRQWPPPKRKRSNNLDDFVVEDDEDEDDGDDILLVCGPCGSGKTSSVYAAAKSLNAFVFEVNCSAKRTGKELASLLDGISHNHAVHSAKNCIILIDDGDIVYENEAGGFWATLSRFTATSRRPVVVTCTDPSRVALSDLVTSIVRLQMPNLVRTTDVAWTVALSEGYMLSKSDVAAVVVAARGDMRKILAHLQFWCQMGVGGLPSGVDWCAKDYEFTENSAQRVISEGSWCPPLRGDIEDDDMLLPEPQLSHPEILDSDFVTATDWISEMTSAFELFSIERRAAPDETVSGNGATVLSEWREPTLHQPPVTSYPMGAPVPSRLPAMRSIFADEYTTGTTSDALIATDVGPFMREIAACDFRRAIIMEQSLAHHQSARGMRMTRRMWAASGIDSRQYMGYSISSLKSILSTCLPAHLFEPSPQ